RDLDGDRDVVLRLRLRPGVELLAELHVVAAVLARGRPGGGRGVRLAGGNLELDETGYLLHFSTPSLRLLYLGKIELDRRCAAEDRNVDADLLFLRLDLDDGPGEVGERTVDHPHRLPLIEGNPRLRAGGPLGHGDVDVLDLRLLDRLRVRAPEESRDLRGVLDQVEGLLV